MWDKVANKTNTCARCAWHSRAPKKKKTSTFWNASSRWNLNTKNWLSSSIRPRSRIWLFRNRSSLSNISSKRWESKISHFKAKINIWFRGLSAWGFSRIMWVSLSHRIMAMVVMAQARQPRPSQMVLEIRALKIRLEAIILATAATIWMGALHK